MIYLITGVPGSGKSLYAVSTLLKELVSQKVKKNGELVTRRLLVDGVTGLVMPHELMAPGNIENDGSVVPTEDGDGLWNWPDWCKPGDVMFVDEVQRWWRPRGNGVKPPRDIKALETHRHLGIDFVIVTQNPMLIDQNVRRLVGRHINVRRLFGGSRAVLYDWDSCSADVSRVQTANKKYWSYPKDAYKLYHSSELHTKQKQTIPLWLIVPVLAVIGGLAVVPKAYSTLSGAMTGKGISSVSAKSVPAVVASAPLPVSSSPVASAGAGPVPSVAVPPGVAASSPVVGSSVEVVAKFSGCMASPKSCVCFDSTGVASEVAPGFCQSHILGQSVPGQKADLSRYSDSAVPSTSSQDLDVLAFIAKRHPSSNF